MVHLLLRCPHDQLVQQRRQFLEYVHTRVPSLLTSWNDSIHLMQLLLAHPKIVDRLAGYAFRCYDLILDFEMFIPDRDLAVDVQILPV